ncbi:MAG: hypothetical protein BRD50_05540 [Bacteroidetes bacterium SW_11_45_7]|nr:MAG: hypothetical protein BRD50_05540 [Bacteroidetes bacterium SW_11_45_7]
MYEKNFDSPHNEELKNLVEQYESMIQNNQQFFFDEGAYEQLLTYYEDRFDYDKAMDLAERAIDQYPFSSTFLVRKAQLLFDAKVSYEALDILDKAEVFDPMDTGIYLLRCDIYLWLSEHQKAADSIFNALDKAEKDELPDLYLELADVYEDGEKYDQVITYLAKALELNPKHEEALNRLWFSVAMTERYEESIDFHKKLIDEEPYSYLAWYNLAHAYSGLGLYEKAVESFEFVYAINEACDYAYCDCADIQSKLGHYQKAVDLYLEALNYTKPTRELYFNIADNYQKLYQFPKARYYFRKAANINPKFDLIFHKIGECYKAEGKWENAIPPYERAFQLNPNKIDYQIALGEVYFQTGQYESAAQIYEQMMNVEPNDEATYFKLAKSYFETGDQDYALFLMDEAEEKFHHNTNILYHKAAFLYLMSRRSECIDILHNALARDYESHTLFLDLAPGAFQDAIVRDVIESYQ